MSDTNLKLSIIIPSYNYANYLDRAVTSIANQNSNIHEIIIVDDGSSDHTKTVVQKLQSKYTQSSIRYFYQDNHGVSVARNYGYSKSTGSHLLFLDADDRLLNGSLEIIRSALIQNPNFDMIFGGYRAIGYDGEIKIRKPNPLKQNGIDNIRTLLNADITGLRPSSAVLKREVLEKIKFPIDVHVDEDTMFFSHVLLYFNCASIPNILVEMPRHADSLRENYQRIIETGVNGVNELFDSLPNIDELNKLKNHVLIKRYLKMGRASYLHHDYKNAFEHYLCAAKLEPRSIFNIKHFPRFVNSFLFKRANKKLL